MRGPCLLFLLIYAASLASSSRPGEFVAGSFILTQKSLNEAPYRYAGVLRKALDKVETKDPPSQSEEKNCDVRYRIRPSGRRSILRIIEDTLSITLKEDNTVVLAAKVYIEVAAKTWIWKGISFGLLGCLKMKSCNGQIVTYSANVDFQIAFQVFWLEDSKRMSIKIKPVDTVLNDVNVRGCKPPWYLWWFKKYQSMLNEGVQEAFQNYANNYEHMTQVPEEFSPLKDIFIHYSVTNLTWSSEQVVFQASATFSTLVDGKNVTFMPNATRQNVIPTGRWEPHSPTDGESHLLQGVRISTEFLNSLMWYASVTNVTQYKGDARVMDSRVNGTISYTPPQIRVEDDDLLSINIQHGLLLATCKPMEEPEKEPETLFKAEFYELAGSGKINLASTRDQTGMRVSLDQLDLSKMNTKPFEPKLPLPEAFENELMKNAISQLQPVVNNYLRSKPLYLPDNFAPLAASPELKLWKTVDGMGYAELTSYCTCSKAKRSVFAVCDARSHICDEKRKRPKQDIRERTTNVPKSEEQGIGSRVKNGIKNGFKNIIGLANGILNDDDEDDDDFSGFDDEGSVNFTALFERSQGNLSYVGHHLSFYEDELDCRLEKTGSAAKVYWLWETSQCSPLYLHGEYLNQYYFLSAHHFKFGCSDSACKFCEYQSLKLSRDKGCQNTPLGQSFHLGLPEMDNFASSNETKSIVASVFFSALSCSFHPRYVEPQLVSTHSNIGPRDAGVCKETPRGDFMNLYVTNDTVRAANWDCSEDCFGCLFRVRNVSIGSCHEYQQGMKILFTHTMFVSEDFIAHTMVGSNGMLYVAITCSIFVTFVVIAVVVCCVRWKKSKANSASPQVAVSTEKLGFKSAAKNRLSSWCSGVSKHVGFRFKSWAKDEWKDIWEDVLQNLMLLLNGSLAILFAIEWNSDNNPLLIIHNKFRNGVAFSISVFDTEKVAQFASTLNTLTLLANAANACLAFLIVLAWCFTTTGGRNAWTRLRLLSAITLLAGIFVVIASVIFTTYFDDLVSLEKDMGFFLTDNDSAHSIATNILKVSLNGMSLTVISFTIVFLFHGVGGGLYCGTVVFRLFHLGTKRSNMEILTTLLVILTIIQPFICLHPVIIWSQDSNHNSTFLLLIIFIWFLPVGVHILVKAVISHCRPKCQSRIDANDEDNDEDNDDTRVSKRDEEKCKKRRTRYMTFFDIVVQSMQLAFFLATFSIITHHIIHTEFNQNRKNLQDFVLPAIVSVFFWMMSISYFLLSLVLDETRRESPLLFKDQNLEAARNLLRHSLRRRLANLDGRSNRARTLMQRQTNLGLSDSINLSESMSSQVSRKRQTLPTSLDLSESMRGRRVLPKDLSTVKVKSKRKSAEIDENPTGKVKDKVSQFEQIKMVPMQRQVSERAKKYMTEPENEDDNPVIDVVQDKIKNDQRLSNKKEDEETIESTNETNESVEVEKPGCWAQTKKIVLFLLERREYRDPLTYGWRIKFRRLFLTLGVVLFTYLTIYTTISTQEFSSKQEIQRVLDYAGTNLTWPDSGSVLDDVFQLYNTMQRTKSYIMIGSSLLFWASLALDFASHFTPSEERKSLYFTGSRMTNFFGSLAVFAGVIVVGLPDYLEASHLDEICPFCGEEFNETVRQVAEFAIGLFFACLFTFQLIPILVTIVPALVRASVLILVHPSLQVEESESTTLRMTILQQVIQFSSLLAFPITFISMAIVQQYQKDVCVTLIIIAFWTFPPFVLFLGLQLTRKFRRYTILLYVYYLYNFCYFALLLSLLLYAMTLERMLEFLEDMMQEPTFWAGSVAQVFLCNVVISDMLYMTVF